MRVAIVLAALALCACSKPTPITPLGSSSNSAELFATATLAPVDSFDAKVAPVYTRIVMTAHRTGAALERGELSKEEAQAINDDLRQAKMLADQARAAPTADAQQALLARALTALPEAK